jgi:hypothetical protein
MRVAWIWRRWFLDLDLSIKKASVATCDECVDGGAVAEGGGSVVVKSGVVAISCVIAFHVYILVF